MLRNWNFSNLVSNSAISQINRQKSARNLTVISIDLKNKAGVFLDPKKDTRNSCSLERCDCKDFNFAGDSPRKKFKPCMHIYRLAAEMGLLELKYDDARAREAKVVQQKQAETARLQGLPRDADKWGGWNAAIHESGIQKNRQFRAYLIQEEGTESVCRQEDAWVIHDHEVTLSECECEDFLDRQLPCKHIYAVALACGLELPLTETDVANAKSRGRDYVFKF
ncbi:MAG: SWIM zinc finger domain-containing protein [Syntrophorhabdaceae bacterium]|nr:SWIM zinc finger domain-containing protein [Syntrophorhabdaceae bacterium]